MRIKMYLHSNKDSNREDGEKLGFFGEALDTFSRALYEVEFDIDVDEKTGETKIIGVNGRKLIDLNEKKNIIYRSYIHYWDAAIYSPYFFTSAEAVDWIDDFISENNWKTISYGDIKIEKAEIIIQKPFVPALEKPEIPDANFIKESEGG